MELFSKPRERPGKGKAPLADRLRPTSLDEFFGQEHILGEGKFLNSAIREKTLPSLILWGPPGSGKTTLARIIAKELGATFLNYSAVLSGIKEIKEAIKRVEGMSLSGGAVVILFIDEIHRFNKAQQDALMPYVENGTVTLIGTSTENPSFEIRNALLSRCRVLSLEKLSSEALEKIARRVINHPDSVAKSSRLSFSDEALEGLIGASDGDGRVLINAMEASMFIAKSRRSKKVDKSIALEALRKKAILYDRGGEEHYNLISAFHKSLRGSDPDAALYWFIRMLKGGEDPLYIARRMIRFASEDIGNADPQSLSMALSAHKAYTVLGSPEGELALAHAVLYLASAPKSNLVYQAFKEAEKDVDHTGYHPVPMHLRNAPTEFMKEEGYGKGYIYPPDVKEGFVREHYFPRSLSPRHYYRPEGSGFERELKERLEGLWGKTRSKKKG